MRLQPSVALALLVVFAVGLVAGFLIGSRMEPQPRNRADCVLHYLKPGLTLPATAMIHKACESKFPS